MIGRLADWMGGYDDVPPKKAVDSSEQRGCSGRISGSKNISCWLEEKNCLKYHMLERKGRACTMHIESIGARKWTEQLQKVFFYGIDYIFGLAIGIQTLA